MLTDEQIMRLLSSYTRGRDLTDIFRDAYRLGMLRAAVVCDDLSTGIAHEYTNNCADAIRTVAGE